MPENQELLVVIPTLGASVFLNHAVASAREVGDAGVRIVCPDGMVEDIRTRFPGLEVAAEGSDGLYSALNTGFRAGGGWRVGTCLNDDDRLDPSGIAASMTAFGDSGVDIVFGRVGLIDSGGRRIGELPVCRNGRDLSQLLARGVMPLAHPGTLFSRRLFDQLGGFDESYRSAGDLDFFVRALVKRAKFRFVNAHVADFRLHDGQISKDESVVAAEWARAVKPLGSSHRGIGPVLRFRLGNMGVYCSRLLRHGPVRMKSLYRTTR